MNLSLNREQGTTSRATEGSSPSSRTEAGMREARAGGDNQGVAEPPNARDESNGHRSVLMSLLALAILSIVLRYPSDFNAVGLDTFYIAGHAQSILLTGRIGWILHPLSYFGLYPASIPAGGPSIFAATAGVAGLPVQGSIVLVDLVLTLLATLVMFLLARSLGFGDVSSLLGAGFFAFSGRLLVLTAGSGSTRSFIVCLVPVILLLLVRIRRVRTTRVIDITLLVSLTVFLFTLHRAAFLVLLLFPAYAGAVAMRRWASRLHNPFLRVGYAGAFSVTLAGMVVAQLRGLIPRPFLLETDYTSGALFSGESLPILLANMIVDYASGLGFAALFVPIGVVFLLLSRPIRFEGTLLLLSFWFLGFVLGQGQYAVLVALPLLVLFAAEGTVRAVPDLVHKSEALAIVALLTVGATAATGVWMTQRWASAGGETIIVQGQLVDTALFIHDQRPGSFFISNDWSPASYKVWAITGDPPLTWSFDPGIINGVLLPGDLNVTFHPGGTGLYETGGPLLERTDWITVMTQDPASPAAQQVLARYDVRYFLEVKSYPNPSTTSVFLDGVHASQYRLYTDDRYSVWMLDRTW